MYYLPSRILTAGTSLVVQSLRICLPMQGIQVQSLVGELRSHRPKGKLSPCAATKIVCVPQIESLARMCPKKDPVESQLKKNDNNPFSQLQYSTTVW